MSRLCPSQRRLTFRQADQIVRPGARFLLGFVVIGTLLLPSGCDRSPRTFEDCVIDVGRTQEFSNAVGVCRVAFPDTMTSRTATTLSTEPRAERFTTPAPYVGLWYYMTIDGGCQEIEFSRPSGMATDRTTVSTVRPGFCGAGSRIECDRTRGCRLTCLPPNPQVETQVYWLDTRFASQEGQGEKIFLRPYNPESAWNPVAGRDSTNTQARVWDLVTGISDWTNTLFNRLADCTIEAQRIRRIRDEGG